MLCHGLMVPSSEPEAQVSLLLALYKESGERREKGREKAAQSAHEAGGQAGGHATRKRDSTSQPAAALRQGRQADSQPGRQANCSPASRKVSKCTPWPQAWGVG